jgi:hypothetical protein
LQLCPPAPLPLSLLAIIVAIVSAIGATVVAVTIVVTVAVGSAGFVPLDGLFADKPSIEVLEGRTKLLAARFAPRSSKKRLQS